MGSLSSAGPGPPRRLQETISHGAAPPPPPTSAGSQDSCLVPFHHDSVWGLLRVEQSLSPLPGLLGATVLETWPRGSWARALEAVGGLTGHGGCGRAQAWSTGRKGRV